MNNIDDEGNDNGEDGESAPNYNIDIRNRFDTLQGEQLDQENHADKRTSSSSISTSDKLNTKSQTIAILGGSIIRNINQTKIRKCTKTRAYVKSFSGAKIEDIRDYVKPILRKNSQQIVLNAGTNDIPSRRAAILLKEKRS